MEIPGDRAGLVEGNRYGTSVAAEASVMPKELFGQALNYLRNQFEHLLVYLDDGLMPIDNNETEKLLKQVALGRNSWMFIGSVAAGYRATDLMSLVSSAHPNDPDIFVYVKDVLDRLLAGECRIAKLHAPQRHVRRREAFPHGDRSLIPAVGSLQSIRQSLRFRRHLDGCRQGYARTFTPVEKAPKPARLRAATWNMKFWPGLSRRSTADGSADVARGYVNHFAPGASRRKRIT
jgi:hypothetical protein